MNFNLRKRKSNLPRVSPCISRRDLEIFRLETANLQKVLGDISRNAASTPTSFQDLVSAMEQWARLTGTLSSRSIIKDNLNITMLGTLSEKVPGIIIPIKISQALANNLSSLIMTHWKCTGRYSFAREHLMLSQWAIEELPQWAKLLVSTKSMNYLNPNAKDILYSWTQTPSNMQSIWRSNLLPIKRSRWCFYQTERIAMILGKGGLKVSI